jgi:hypothetical protein
MEERFVPFGEGISDWRTASSEESRNRAELVTYLSLLLVGQRAITGEIEKSRSQVRDRHSSKVGTKKLAVAG